MTNLSLPCPPKPFAHEHPVDACLPPYEFLKKHKEAKGLKRHRKPWVLAIMGPLQDA